MARYGARQLSVVLFGTIVGIAAGDHLSVRERPKQTPGDARFREAVDSMQKRDWKAADSAFRSALQAEPRDLGSLLGAADVAMQQSRIAEAAEFLKKAVALAPENGTVHQAWGRYHFSQGKIQDAKIALTKAVRFAPNEAGPLIDLGDLELMGLGNAAQAVAAYQKAVLLNPSHGGAYYALGTALAKTGQIKESEAALRSAVRLSPSNPLPYDALGRLMIGKNDPAGALEAFASAIKIQSSFVPAYLARGDVFASEGQTAKALEEFSRASKAAPTSSAPFLNTGMLHQQSGRWKDAEQAYRKAVELNPREALAFNNLAWMAAEKRIAIDQAETWAKKAIELAPKEAQFRDTLAWVYRAKGEPDKARAILQEAARIDANQADLNYHLGILSQETGKSREALAYFAKVLTSDKNYPQSADVRSRMASLQKR